MDRMHLTRRDFPKLLGSAALDYFLRPAAGAGYGYLLASNQFKVETIRLKLPRLSRSFSGLRVAQISDIHMGSWMNAHRLQQVANLVVAQSPDLLVITGDFLVGKGFGARSRMCLQELRKVLMPLATSIPSFAVLGNHDYWTNPDAIREMLQLCKITDLTNSVFTLTRGSEHLHMCGVDDVRTGDVRLDDVLAQLQDDSAAILLVHEPDFADTSAGTGRFDLQISGHTHGGQVVFPYLGPLVLPYLGRKYPAGLYKVGNMFQYTNRGVGSARLPIRINCPPEITIFVLESTVS